MNRTSYRLHSVLVHQGQASRGHYWAYVRKKKTKKKVTREMGIQASYLDDEQTEEETKVEGGGGGVDNSEGKGEEGEGHEDMEVTTIGGDTDVETLSSPLSCDQSSAPSSIAPPEVKREEETKRLKDDEDEIWLKYNDVSVTTVDWEEVKRESFGGGESACNSNGTGTNTSAYCLLYVNSEAAKTWREEGI